MHSSAAVGARGTALLLDLREEFEFEGNAEDEEKGGRRNGESTVSKQVERL